MGTPRSLESRAALAHCVCVVALGRGSTRNGLTATSVVSLAAEPPTLLFCVNRSSSAREALRRGVDISVNILSGAQEIVADNFAGRGGLKGGFLRSNEQFVPIIA